jgi:histidinol phosphatase-like enzyme (inositol monophosphatase family)
MHPELDLGTIASMLNEAGAIALRWFRTPLDAIDKGGAAGYDPVTEADRGIETLLRERLMAQFGDHEIVGEEFGTTGVPGRYRWLIDPIDGTKAFVTGSPLWGILLGLLDDDRPVAGWIHQPYLEETFSGFADGEAWLERRGSRTPLRTRQGVDLADAVLYCTTPAMFTAPAELAAFRAVSDHARLVRYGGDCYAYAQLAMGQVDVVIDTGLQPYDIVPIIPVVEAAGGMVSGPAGGPASAGGFVIATATDQLHEQIINVIQEAFA